MTQTANEPATNVRPTAVAGTFYPAEQAALAKMLEDCINGAEAYALAPKALIVPHAGFVYSGPIAGTAYKAVLERREEIKRVVLLGPPHRMAVRTFAIPSVDAFATPFGPVPLDRPVLDRLALRDDVEVADAPHAEEHSLEVQLPFLKAVLPDFTLVPILVGGAPRPAVEALLADLWGGSETLIVISSDLSHYHDYGRAQQLDGAVGRLIEALKPDEIADEQACGRYPMKGLLGRAAALDLRATTLDIRNSGDTAGANQRDRVVGYGAWAFEYSADAHLAPHDRAQLVDAARRSIGNGIQNGRAAKVRTETFSWPLRALRATFVTLELDDKLRGCIGSILPHQELIGDVVENAYKAAFQDKRFAVLTAAEAERLDISVSILSHPRPIAFRSEVEAVDALRPDIDGVILQARDAGGSERRGLFLPQVWKSVPEPKTFMAHLKAKAGLAPEFWNDSVRLWRYRTETFH